MTAPPAHEPSGDGASGRAGARRVLALRAAVVVAFGIFAVMLFKHLSYPLLWSDEGETVMYGVRVLEYGYPKVHGARNVVYELDAPLRVGVKEIHDSYIGNNWGHYYVAALGVWWARSVPDLHAKTLRLRLPFALAGAVGVVFFFVSVARGFGGDRRDRLLFLLLAFALEAIAVSFILHIREARAYPLVVLLLAAALHLYLGRFVLGRTGAIAYFGGLALVLFLFFNTFYPGWAALSAAMVLDCARRAKRGAGSARKRIGVWLRDAFPILLAGVAVLPLLAYFETFRVALAVARKLQRMGGPSYWEHLGASLSYFLHHDFLAPALVVKLALWLLRREDRDLEAPTARISSFLTLFFVVYCAIGAFNPIFFERYYVALNPVLTAILLLDSFALVRAAPAVWKRWPARRARAAAAIAIVVCSLPVLWLKAPEIRGRIFELVHPYQGPLDFVIPFLAQQAEDPTQLVIATNYEATVYMYYLGAHVIVGYTKANLEADMKLQPDVIVPREVWLSRELLHELYQKGSYVRARFPIQDSRTNNIPSLMATDIFPESHKFRTLRAAKREDGLAIWVRTQPGRRPPATPNGRERP